MKRLKKTKNQKIKKKNVRLKGDSSPVLILIAFLFGLMAIGVFYANSQRNNTPAPNPAPPVTEDNRMSMETFYISPTVTPLPTQPVTPTVSACSTSVSDTMIIVDNSASMAVLGSNIRAQQAVFSFIDRVGVNSQSRIGLTVFNSTASLNNSLTNDFQSIKTNMGSLLPSGETCIQCGIQTANADIAANKRTGVKQNVILLTDGYANVIVGSTSIISNPTAKQAAVDEALKGYAESSITYYTVGFGLVDEDALQQIANQTGGISYISPDNTQLERFFNLIAANICQQ